MSGLIRTRLHGLRAWHRRGCLGRYLVARLLAATGLCRFFTIRRTGYVLRFHPAALATTLWACPSDREQDHAVFATILRPGDQVIDVGANVGDLTLHASSLVGPQGRVYAIEPHPRTFRFLQENVSVNAVENVISLNAALGAENGWVSLSDHRSDDQNAVAAIGSAGLMTVPLRRLDDLDIEGRVHLLKIDVEGYEKFVLQGAEGLLDRVQTIYFEAWDSHFRRFGYTVSDLVGWLEERSFLICTVTNGIRIEPLTRALASGGTDNLLAIRADVLDRLRER